MRNLLTTPQHQINRSKISANSNGAIENFSSTVPCSINTRTKVQQYIMSTKTENERILTMTAKQTDIKLKSKTIQKNNDADGKKRTSLKSLADIYAKRADASSKLPYSSIGDAIE